MELNVKQEHGCAVVAVKDRLDTLTVWDFEQKVNGLIGEGSRRFVLDFSGLDYISSAGLRSILALAKKVKGQGGGVALFGLKGLVKEIFAVSGFDTVLPIFEDEAPAIQSFGNAQ